MAEISANDGGGSAAYLRLSGIHKRFGSFWALRDVCLEVMEGELVCFLGPSGCGKTTLLRIVAGLETQTSGKVEQAGRDISVLPPERRDFGIVFQSYALFPNLSVRSNVAYGLENRRLPRTEIRQRVDELLRLVGLPEQGEKYPAQLSGGEQQRVALARALATSPGLLLLDEPLSALDAKVRVRLRSEIKDLQHRLGVTTVMVTHDQEEALTMADRIVVMDQGVVAQIGTPEEIYRRPATAFVADFIGNMNFLPGQVVEGGVRLGAQVLCCATGEHLTGTAVTVAIRPEDVVPAAGAAGNCLEGTVLEVEFLGAFLRMTLALADASGPTLRMDLPVHQSRNLDTRPGVRLSLTLPPEQLHLFAGEAVEAYG